MVDIDGVLAGKRPARIGPEYISIADYHGMVALLVYFAAHLDADRATPLLDRMEQYHRRHARLLA